MDEILQVFEDFQHQSHGRGRLSKSDFVKVYKQAFKGKNGVKALAENIFTAFDTDNSGFVDFEEFLAVSDVVPDDSFLQGLSPQAFSDRLFAEVDANGDGDITFEEFRMAAEQNETLIDLLLPSPT
ncbi:NCS1-like protein [Mya arenaria]|uniref:NCS1-like protein n=1 Tax=Mya arenaria TaxID=6604 RepID=A0ABY7FU65_MYAAR|nr:NCS1-like protein [Mya arenaria]